ncbi:MAG: hypothetical protein HQK76_12160 [Desulfobacterales bacterium]|nr:hypothetical protein [Desulfobacterales bacterium]
MLTVDFNKIGVKPYYKILDIGCGSGRHTCGRDEIAQVPIIMDYLKYFDPVERNDFWWDH